MSQTQLMSFTNSSKNCVKRSLDRLEKQGLIEQWEDYEHGRVSRVWLVHIPKDNKGTKKTLSNSNTVQIQQSSTEIDSGSKMDTQTVSKIDTSQYNKQINPQHTLPESLKNYFETLKPQKKLHQEVFAFEELQREFSIAQIESSFLYIQKHGIGDQREKPHSPMAYLGMAIGSVLQKISKKVGGLEKLRPTIALSTDENAGEYEEAKRIFFEAIPDEGDRASIIKSYSLKHPYLDPNGGILGRIAILDWWATSAEGSAKQRISS